jgi:hypothetical protein
MSNGGAPSRSPKVSLSRSEADGRNGFATAVVHPVPTTLASASLFPPQGGRFVSRFLYWSCYYVSYRIVFSTFFIASFVPGSSPVTTGLTDGAKAASAAASHNRAVKC